MNQPQPPSQETVEATQQKISVEHIAWTNHPVTKALVKVLREQQEKEMKSVGRMSANPKEFTSEEVRLAGMQLHKTIELLKTINETEHFVKLVTRQ
jgi:hypothetical protein